VINFVCVRAWMRACAHYSFYRSHTGINNSHTDINNVVHSMLKHPLWNLYTLRLISSRYWYFPNLIVI